MSFGVLGWLEVHDSEGTRLRPLPPRQRQILCMLLLRANSFVSASDLSEGLWSLPLTDSRQRALWVSVSRLRETLGADRGGGPIFTQPGGYRLEVTAEQFDALRFERRLARGIELGRGRPEQALRELEAAESLWRGRAYADVEFESVFATEADRLNNLRDTAREYRLDAALELGRHQQVLEEVTPFAREDWLREPTQRIYLLALYRCGRKVEACRHYDRLWEELRGSGLEPGPAMQDLYDRMVANDPLLDGPAAGTAERSPHPNLPAGARVALDGPPFVTMAGTGEILAGGDRDGPAVVVIRGEAGSGKSRLAAELARRHHERDETVLWGRAVAGHVAPYQAFVDALAPLLDHAPGEGPMGALARAEADADPAPDGDSAPEGGLGPAARRDLFETVVARLRAATNATNVVMVIDDFQWLGDDSVALWHHVLRARVVGVTLVVTMRTGGAADTAEPRWLTELRRQGEATVVELAGLSAAAIEELAGHLGRSLRPADTEALVARTDGNAFYVVAALSESARHDDPGEVPDGVRATVLEAFRRLPRDCRHVLEVAALVGRGFALDVVTGPAGLTDAGPAVAPAVEAGILRTTADAGRLEFCHDIVREVVAGQLDDVTRSQIHRLLGLEGEATAGSGRTAAELASHFLAGAGTDLGRVAHYSIVAGDEARTAMAHGDAAFHFRRALDAIALDRPGDRLDRCRLLVREGEALRAAYHSSRARSSLVEAATLALELGDEDQLDRAVAALVWVHEYGDTESDALRILNRAKRRPHQPAGRRALFALARARLVDLPRAEEDDLLDEAEVLARESGDDALLGFVLITACLSRWRPGTVSWRDRTAEEIQRLGERSGAREVELESYRLRAAARLELGDVHSAVENRRRFVHRGANEGRANFDAGVGQVENSLDMLLGRFADAETRLPRLLDGVADSPNFAAAYGLQLYHLRREQGRAAETLPLLREMLDDSRFPALRVAVSVAELELGNEKQGRDQLDRAIAGGLGVFAEDWLWMGTMAGLAEAAAMSGHAELAGEVHEAIEPYADLLVVLAHNVLCMGSAHRFVGQAAVTAGRHAEGVEHLRAAVRVDEGLGAWPALARDHLALGLALSPGTPGPADLAAARPALEEARRRGRDYGLPLVRAAAEHALDQL